MLLLIFWGVISLFLFLFSFTQVDLGLTLTQLPLWQGIQKAFQDLGFFNRPLSTQLYLLLLTSFFALYFYTLYAITKKKITRSLLKRVILVVTALLLFSYNAFSYDIFNYIFDAKIVTFYHENPYESKALDFPADPMLGFMRYIERDYPYGPGWLAISVPISYLGFQYFLLTFYLFKILMAAAFLGSAFLLEKIARKTKVIDPLFAVAFFALNPLVIIESLVSSHNDIVMLFFIILALYYVVSEKYGRSILFYLISISIKFATVFALPMFLYRFFKKNKERYFDMLIIVMITAVILAAMRLYFQPWYLMYLLPFIAFRAKKYYFFLPINMLAFGALLLYAVYLFHGDVDPEVARFMGQVQDGTVLITIVVTAVVMLVQLIRHKFKYL